MNYYKMSFPLVAIFFCVCVGATPVEIVGDADLELVNSITLSRDVVETASLRIIVDGNTYKISCELMGDKNLSEEMGSDGNDFFLVSSRISPFNMDGKGHSAFAYPGRFPQISSPIIQCVWMAYCSSGFFQNVSNCVDLPISKIMTGIASGTLTTNIARFVGDSLLPQSINAWTGHLMETEVNGTLADYYWYKNGFIVYHYEGTNYTVLNNISFPQEAELDSYFPKVPPKRDTSTLLEPTNSKVMRIVHFHARSIKPFSGEFSLLPNATVGQPIIDERFKYLTEKFYVTSFVGSNGWPCKGTVGYQDSVNKARQIAIDNGFLINKPARSRSVFYGIVLANILILVSVGTILRKTHKTKTTQN